MATIDLHYRRFYMFKDDFNGLTKSDTRPNTDKLGLSRKQHKHIRQCQEDVSMSHDILDIFRRRLETVNSSDFHGLISPGLTCYLNSVLQVLFMTDEFRDRIKRCSEDATTFDIHLKSLFTTLEKNKAKTHAITEILGIEDVHEQRDAAEYFEKILRLTTPEASTIFKGELNHMTICCRCDTRNNAPGFFWILPLSIRDPHQTYRVNKGIEDFFNKEKVSGENKIYCAKCDEKQDAIVMYEMRKLPEVLTLLLKRFHYVSDLKCNIKVNCAVEVPLTLNIEDNTYKLYAMVKHYGTLTGGHYIANIFSSLTKEWYDFNDERVKLKKKQYMMPGKPYLRSRSSYLLMYMKRSRNPENLIENKEETPDADETHVTLTNEQMETSRNRERESRVQDDYKADMDTVGFGPSKSQPNSHLLHSRWKGNHTEWNSSKLQGRAEILHKRSAKPMSALDSQKSVHQRAFDRYSPKTGKRPLKSSKYETSIPWK